CLAAIDRPRALGLLAGAQEVVARAHRARAGAVRRPGRADPGLGGRALPLHGLLMSPSPASPARDARELRRVGLTGGGVVLVLRVGLVSRWRGHSVAPLVLGTAGVLLVLPGLLAPRLLAPVERGWMRFAAVMGHVNTRIILTVLYYLVITPVGIVRRWMRDPLDRAMRDGRPSVWVRRSPRPPDPARDREPVRWPPASASPPSTTTPRRAWCATARSSPRRRRNASPARSTTPGSRGTRSRIASRARASPRPTWTTSASTTSPCSSSSACSSSTSAWRRVG